MRRFLGICAMICLFGCFAWVGGMEAETIDFGLGALLLILTVIAFGVFALAAQNWVEGKK